MTKEERERKENQGRKGGNLFVLIPMNSPVSLILFELYINEIFRFHGQIGGPGARLARGLMPVVLYADDIILTSDSWRALKNIQMFHMIFVRKF